ncbi:MAG: 4Fe-4S dicluster domain-containing protein [Labilithrix sp.]|nr:4Fe-4S dicluster domain-containing protein [Labilithrix sp.]MCW5815672.1 4Fe-4S dicluster domain-containing protein [Labilithrix sp.]
MIARRELLGWLGSSFALAACTRAPREEILPYAQRPPEVTPGKPRYYATASVLDGYATGTLVESHEGRPTKVEGNPDHPASLGATSAFEQAAIRSLYDPRRARGDGWDRAAAELRAARDVTLVLEPTSSPSVAALVDAIRSRRPDVRVAFHSIGSPRAAWEGARVAFGRVLEPRYDLRRADVVVALDADFLGRGPQRLRLARDLAARRGSADPSRLYALGPLVTITSSVADHRVRVRAVDVLARALDLAGLVGLGPAPVAPTPELRAIARDLLARRGRSAVIAGDDQPALVHAVAHALNAFLGNVASTVTYAPSPILDAGEKSHDAPAGGASTVVHCGVDPSRLSLTAPRTACLSLYPAAGATVTLAEAHPLESWGDARAFDGTTSVVQPLIAPLFGGRTTLDVLALFAGGAGAYALVRGRFADDRAWRRALRRGVVDGSALATVTPELDPSAVVARARAEARAPAPGIELVTPLDPRLHDGRFADNAWLLELPQPVTTLTWTNAATFSPAAAARLGLADGDEVELGREGGHARVVRAPALVVAGQADDVVGLNLGWGRGHGVDAAAIGAGTGLVVTKTGARVPLPLVQLHHDLAGRGEHIAQHRTLAEERARKPPPRRRALTLYQPPRHEGPQWGMVIDLSRCIGCGVCTVACQAENNVPSVGAEEVLRGRVMHWLRIDRYVAGDELIAQPMLCQHCEKAPCEYVCPVGATTHSPDGINEMTYNRCVGTRFCSNNCPYKVRRFNWFDYHRAETKTEELAHNPDVTVRERGVIEKCTFCVQRLRAHAPAAPLTACQQACPAEAIVFGDLEDERAPVARLAASDRAYAALEELGTEPRVRYLAKIRNPNPELG